MNYFASGQFIVGCNWKNLAGEIGLEEYWMILKDNLPILSKIALLPISSCNIERG